MPVSYCLMIVQSNKQLLARLALVITRIEAAASGLAVHPAADQSTLSRHEALRAEVRETLTALDTVIAHAQDARI